jgi:hypothetical protein
MSKAVILFCVKNVHLQNQKWAIDNPNVWGKAKEKVI